ncbi:MAG: S8 family serine peptidase [Corallococcus sp.]|nr:S8 family serine peptidase [Corallococcus sp.]
MGQAFAETSGKIYSTATLNDDFADDKVIVMLNDTVQSEAFETKCINENYCVKTELLTDASFTEGKSSDVKTTLLLTLKEKSKQNVLDVIHRLEKDDEVYFAAPDYNVSQCADGDIAIVEYPQWALEKISAQSAWGISKGSTAVKVGVLDTGIDSNHSDLRDNMDLTLNRDFTADDAAAISQPTDVNGHGTHVAGIIGAAHNNSGINGVCEKVKLVSLKVLKDNGKGSLSFLCKAIQYANSQEIPILNYSAGALSSDIGDYQTLLKNALQSYSGLFVCAAGNAGNDNDTLAHYPSNFDLPNLISVASSDNNNNRSDESDWASNYGKTTVDLFAPGSGIISTYPNNKYVRRSGTSMASPHVAGVAALLLSKYPNLYPAQLKYYITSNVTKKDALSDKCVSGGILNAYDALTHKNHTQHDYHYSYEWTSYTKHNAYCICGDYQSKGHTVTTSSFTFAIGQYKTCTLCKGLAEMGFVVTPPLSNVFQTSTGVYVILTDSKYTASNYSSYKEYIDEVI